MAHFISSASPRAPTRGDASRIGKNITGA